MKSLLTLVAAFTLGTAGPALAGMQGQGARPDARVPEFKELDADRDGYIETGDVKDPALKEQWTVLDTNKDNKLDKGEFSAFERAATPHQKKALEEYKD
jgi:Ca2+-binding EF-hand superfamily protein